jgi:hypothetical protein
VDDEIADREALRREIRGKYRDVAVDPERSFDFYTGRTLAHRLDHPHSIVDPLPDRPVESFAGGSRLRARGLARHTRRGSSPHSHISRSGAFCQVHARAFDGHSFVRRPEALTPGKPGPGISGLQYRRPLRLNHSPPGPAR